MRTMKFSELIILFLGIPLILLIARINVQILIFCATMSYCHSKFYVFHENKKLMQGYQD